MPQEFWYTTDQASVSLPAGYDDFTNVGGANKNASVRIGGGRSGPATHDDDTTYVQSGEATTSDQAFNVDWPGPMISYDGVLTAGVRHKYVAGPATNRQAAFVNGSGTEGGTLFLNVTDANTSYVTTGPVDVSNAVNYRPGAGSWSAADFDDATSVFPFFTFGASSGGTSNFTSVFGEISYTPPSGGFAFLLQLAGLGALPFVGHMADFSQFMRYLSWRRRYHPRHTLMRSRDEVMLAWREVQAHKHASFFLPRFA